MWITKQKSMGNKKSDELIILYKWLPHESAMKI